MNRAQPAHTQVWQTEDQRLLFEFEIVYGENADIERIDFSAYFRGEAQETLRGSIDDLRGRVSLEHRFPSGNYLRGALRCDFLHGQYGIWADIYYGPYGQISEQGHFEGLMFLFGAQPAPPVPPSPIPTPPVDGDPRFVIDQSDAGDLFPYLYMRQWPGIGAAELETFFAQYQEYTPSPPASPTLYQTLRAMKRTLPNARTQMEKLVVFFIEGILPQSKESDRFVSSIDDLRGPLRLFPLVGEDVRASASIDLEELIAIAGRVLGMAADPLRIYLRSSDYLSEKDRVWQSYIALVIVMGYDFALLEELTQLLVAAHLLEVALSSPPEKVETRQLERLARASILLPGDVFPLPPSPSSPPVESTNVGWIEPYAVGDLQMVRHRLLRYQAGEIAHLENVMRGERKETVSRRRHQKEEARRDSRADEQEWSAEDRDQRADLLGETLRTIAEESATTQYDNFKTTYGPPTLVTLDGKWTSTRRAGAPSTEEISRFAREILGKTVHRIARRVGEERACTTLDEREERVQQIFDNAGGGQDLIGVYRWVNKVYAIDVVGRGTRMVVEFMLRRPAFRYIEETRALQGESLARPLPLARLGIGSHADINQENYGPLAARYGVFDLDPPPPEQRVATATLQGDGVQQVAVPDGYRATRACVTTIAAPSADLDRLEGLVGQHRFGGSTDTQQFALQNEDATVPVALSLAASLSSPPSAPGTCAVTVEIVCEPTPQTFGRWQIETYKAIAEGFASQQSAYYERAGSQLRSPLAHRRIERRELKRDCIRLLLDRYLQRVGEPDEPATAPSSFSVNQPHYLQFFDEVFDWNNMSYSFDIVPSHRAALLSIQPGALAAEDGPFSAFLQADRARVLVPVRPEFALACVYYLSSGAIWPGTDELAPVNYSDRTLVCELKKATETPAPAGTEEATWEVVVPTAMQVLQNGDGVALPAEEAGSGENPST